VQLRQRNRLLAILSRFKWPVAVGATQYLAKQFFAWHLEEDMAPAVALREVVLAMRHGQDATAPAGAAHRMVFGTMTADAGAALGTARAG